MNIKPHCMHGEQWWFIYVQQKWRWTSFRVSRAIDGSLLLKMSRASCTWCGNPYFILIYYRVASFTYCINITKRNECEKFDFFFFFVFHDNFSPFSSKDILDLAWIDLISIVIFSELQRSVKAREILKYNLE